MARITGQQAQDEIFDFNANDAIHGVLQETANCYNDLKNVGSIGVNLIKGDYGKIGKTISGMAKNKFEDYKGNFKEETNKKTIGGSLNDGMNEIGNISNNAINGAKSTVAGGFKAGSKAVNGIKKKMTKKKTYKNNLADDIDTMNQKLSSIGNSLSENIDENGNIYINKKKQLDFKFGEQGIYQIQENNYSVQIEEELAIINNKIFKYKEIIYEREETSKSLFNILNTTDSKLKTIISKIKDKQTQEEIIELKRDFGSKMASKMSMLNIQIKRLKNDPEYKHIENVKNGNIHKDFENDKEDIKKMMQNIIASYILNIIKKWKNNAGGLKLGGFIKLHKATILENFNEELKSEFNLYGKKIAKKHNIDAMKIIVI